MIEEIKNVRLSSQQDLPDSVRAAISLLNRTAPVEKMVRNPTLTSEQEDLILHLIDLAARYPHGTGSIRIFADLRFPLIFVDPNNVEKIHRTLLEVARQNRFYDEVSDRRPVTCHILR